VSYVVERALERIRERVQPVSDEPDRHRLAQIERELENLVRLAAKLGDLDAHTVVLEELRQERDEILRRLRAAPASPLIDFDPDSLRSAVEASVEDLRRPLAGPPDKMRTALRALMGDRRMVVWQDSEKGYRVEGVTGLALEKKTPRPVMALGVSSRW